MTDKLGRQISYIRVSVTDRCNLRCRYCMPAGGVPAKQHSDILSYEEIERIIRQCALLGVSRVRITGGEPLVRKGILGLIEKINAIPGIEEINITTNGILLPQYAHDLKTAGVKNINISLDTLDADKYAYLTRGGNINAVLDGIESACEEGFNKIKINTVMMRGFNTDEIDTLIQLIRYRDIYLRFIELMPIGEAEKEEENRYISSFEIMQMLPNLREAAREKGSGPAKYYTMDGYKGFLGFINPLSNCFCGECNRIRLTADGKIMPCLHSKLEVDLKPFLASPEDALLQKAIVRAVDLKPERHKMESTNNNIEKNDRYMVQVGG